MRSRPLETICVGERNFTALMKDSWPPSEADGEVARMFDEVSHIRIRLS